MSAVRDGQDVDPQDSSRIIYRFRQSVSSSTSSFVSSLPNRRSVLLFLLLLLILLLFLLPAPTVSQFFFFFFISSFSDISNLQQVPMPSYLIAIVVGALESRYLSHLCVSVCLCVGTLTLRSDWSTGRSAPAPESGQRESLWTRQRLSSQRLASLTPHDL